MITSKRILALGLVMALIIVPLEATLSYTQLKEIPSNSWETVKIIGPAFIAGLIIAVGEPLVCLQALYRGKISTKKVVIMWLTIGAAASLMYQSFSRAHQAVKGNRMLQESIALSQAAQSKKENETEPPLVPLS